MPWQFTIYTWILLATTLLSLGMAIYIYYKRHISNRVLFIVTIIMAAEWALAATIETAVPTIALKSLFSKIEYIGALSSPVFFLLYIMDYTQLATKWLKNWQWTLWLIPGVSLLLVFTNEWHHLIWSGFSWSAAGSNILTYHHAIVFFIATSYPLLLLLFSVAFLLRFVVTNPAFHKTTVFYYILCLIFPFSFTIIYQLGLSPVEGLDITPISVLFAVLIVTLGITRQKLFNLVPVARHLLIEKMNNGILVLDKFQHILDFNPATAKMFGIDKLAIGKKAYHVIPAFKHFLNEIASTAERQSTIYFDKPEPRWYEINKTPLVDNKGHSLGNLLVITDITQQKKDEQQLQKLNAQLLESENKLKEINNQKDKLFSIIAHDLKNPFQALIGFSELLYEDTENYSIPEIKEMSGNIFKAANQGFEILTNLLDWSRSQTNRIEFRPVDTNLNKFLARSVSQIDLFSSGKDIKVEFYPSEEARVMIDRNMIDTVMRNLLTNAIKFSYPGSKVEVFFKKNTDSCIVSVKDNGTGIPPEALASLFRIDIKQTTVGTSGEQGTGLGLILCKEFIEKHGGKIWVESTPGKGSEFLFSLPITTSSKSPATS